MGFFSDIFEKIKEPFEEVGQFVERTFMPESAKEVLGNVPILGDLIEKGWMGPMWQQMTPEGIKAAETMSGGTSLARWLGPVAAILGGTALLPALGAGAGAGAAGAAGAGATGAGTSGLGSFLSGLTGNVASLFGGGGAGGAGLAGTAATEIFPGVFAPTSQAAGLSSAMFAPTAAGAGGGGFLSNILGSLGLGGTAAGGQGQPVTYIGGQPVYASQTIQGGGGATGDWLANLLQGSATGGGGGGGLNLGNIISQILGGGGQQQPTGTTQQQGGGGILNQILSSLGIGGQAGAGTTGGGINWGGLLPAAAALYGASEIETPETPTAPQLQFPSWMEDIPQKTLDLIQQGMGQQITEPGEYPIASQALQQMLTYQPEQYQLPIRNIMEALGKEQELGLTRTLKMIKPSAAEQGWLDSSRWTELLSGIGTGMATQSSQMFANLLTEQARENLATQRWLPELKTNVANLLAGVGGQRFGVQQYGMEYPYATAIPALRQLYGGGLEEAQLGYQQPTQAYEQQLREYWDRVKGQQDLGQTLSKFAMTSLFPQQASTMYQPQWNTGNLLSSLGIS